MNRRAILGAGVLLPMLLSGRAVAAGDDAASDWKPIEGLLNLCKTMMDTADLMGAGVDRNLFVNLLLRMDRPLRQIEAAKGQVKTAITLVDCTANPGPALSIAQQAAQEIIPLVTALAARVEQLEDAVKPASVRTQVAEVARSLNTLQSRKMWVHRVNQFCSVSPAQRTAFLSEIEASTAIVVKARAALDALIAKLDPDRA